MYKHVIVISAALSEELGHTYEYMSSRYEADTAAQTRISHLNISPYEKRHTRFLIHTTTSSGFVSLQDNNMPPPPQCSAFRIDADTLCLLLVTGYGSKAVLDTVSTIYDYFTPTSIYFAGCALGLSEGITAYTAVPVVVTVQVDAPSETRCPLEMFEHTLSNIGTHYDTMSCEEGAADFPLVGVALCGDIFIDVIKRRSMVSGTHNALSSMLPDPARPYLTVIMNSSDIYGYTIPTVFDMESAALVQCIASYLPQQNPLDTHVRIMRVVLDTLFDTRKIHFRRDIIQVSDIICEWVCRHAGV